MLPAESAVLVHLHSIGVVLFVLHGIIVPLFAFAASKCYFNSHIYTSQRLGTTILYNKNTKMPQKYIKIAF